MRPDNGTGPWFFIWDKGPKQAKPMLTGRKPASQRPGFLKLFGHDISRGS